MPTPAPNSRLQVVTALTARHVVPVHDIDRPELKGLVAPATSLGVLSGVGAPVDYVAPVNATLTIDSVAANSDLTFTAATAGAAGNSLTVAILQPVTNDEVLTVSFDGTDAIISLPTDGGGSPVATTAAEVKAAWDATIYVAPPNAYPLTAFITVAVEGDGSGAVGAAAEAPLATGVTEVLGTGYGLNSVIYVDTDTPGLYINSGTSAEPAWTAV